MTSENPFEVSALYGDNVEAVSRYPFPTDFDVDGHLVVCGPVLELPPICMYTGSTEDLVPEMRRTTNPSMKLVVVDRYCLITLYVARAEKTRRAKISLMLGTSAAIGVAMIVLSIWLGRRDTAVLFPIGLLVAIVAIFYLHRWNSPLLLVRYKAPGIHWVKGFPKSFLANLAMYRVSQIGRSKVSNSGASVVRNSVRSEDPDTKTV